MEKKYLILFIFIAVIAFIIGFLFGTWTTMKAVVEVASNFIEIDYDLVNKAITQYRGNIKGCWGNEIFQNITS